MHNQFVATAGHFFDPHYSCNYVLYSDDEGRSWQMNKDGAIMISGGSSSGVAVAVQGATQRMLHDRERERAARVGAGQHTFAVRRVRERLFAPAERQQRHRPDPKRGDAERPRRAWK